MILEPATGRALPENAIQRVLYIANNVHVYQIPPLTSNRGFNASPWTSPTQPTARQIFTARLRIIETSLESRLSTCIVLEDADSGDLFAAAPYTSTAVVQAALDSSRFFAIRIQGDGGMRATLGIGFEDRSPAFDFSIALTEAQKVLGLAGMRDESRSSSGKRDDTIKQDFRLKEGEKIRIQVGSKGKRQVAVTNSTESAGTALFSLAPPPPPPCKAGHDTSKATAQELGFDDGEFGEFQ